jgi:hypothetical protein
MVRFERKLHPNRISGPNFPTGQDNTHDARLTNQATLVVARQNGTHKARAVVIQLLARIPQSGDAHDGILADMQLRAAWQAQQVHATRRDIFSDCPRSELETSRIEFIKQFFMEQVYLPQIWLRRVFGNTRSVLDSSSQMSITIHAQTGQERDAIVDWLGELMHLADSDEVARVYRFEVARGFRDDVAHLSDLISPGGEAFWLVDCLASGKPLGQS